MIDRIISRLAICRLIESYIEKYGAFRRDKIKRDKVLELEPALGLNYLAFSNSIDRALIALGLNARKPQEPELMDYVRMKYGDSQEGQGKETGESEKSPQNTMSPEISSKDEGSQGDGGLKYENT